MEGPGAAGNAIGWRAVAARHGSCGREGRAVAARLRRDPLGAAWGCRSDPHGAARGDLCGVDLSGGWTFGYAGLTGDMEFMRDANLQIASARYYACRNCCPKCHASTVDPTLDCYSVQDGAEWRDTIITTEHFLANTPEEELPPLHELHGWAYELNLDDCLHILFLGVVQDLVGSCLVLLCLRGFYGPGNLSEQLLTCHLEAVRFAAGALVVPPFSRAALNIEEVGSYPEMGGQSSPAETLAWVCSFRGRALCNCTSWLCRSSLVPHSDVVTSRCCGNDGYEWRSLRRCSS